MLPNLGLPVALGDIRGAGLGNHCFCAQLELASPRDGLQSWVPEKGKGSLSIACVVQAFEKIRISKTLSSVCNAVKIY